MKIKTEKIVYSTCKLRIITEKKKKGKKGNDFHAIENLAKLEIIITIYVSTSNFTQNTGIKLKID